MDLDKIEEALTGETISGTEVIVALSLVVIGGLMFVLVGKLLRRASDRWAQSVLPGEAFDVGIRLAQFFVLGAFVAWALTVLGSNVRWLTLLTITFIVVSAILAKPFVDGLTSSVLVATRTAFSIGDEIEVEGVIGEVAKIGNRSTIIRTRDGRRVHIPHSELADKTITVFTAYEERRSTLAVTLDLGTDLQHADEVIREALDEVDAITRLGSIRAQSFDDGVVLTIRFWHGPRLPDATIAVDGAVRAIHVAFAEAGIEFAPSSSIRIDQP
jgi:small-conductance mechanosensitive channel